MKCSVLLFTSTTSSDQLLVTTHRTYYLFTIVNIGLADRYNVPWVNLINYDDKLINQA